MPSCKRFFSALILFILLKASSASTECTEIEYPPNRSCPLGMVETPPPLTCVDFTDKTGIVSLGWLENCQKGSKLIEMYKREWIDWFVAQNTHKRNYLLGMIAKRGAGWFSMTGLTVKDFYWAPGEPDIPPYLIPYRCAYMKSSEGSWGDISCSDNKKYIACHQVHPLGPTKPTMYLNIHRPPNILYFGHTVDITCSAFNAEDNHLDWTFSNEKDSALTGPGAIIDEKRVLGRHPEYDTCSNKAVSVYSFNTTKEINSIMHVSCFSRRVSKTSVCISKAHSLAMCNLQVLKFVDGPKQRPIARYIYDGAPGPVTTGFLVDVNCTVYTGERGKLTWVVNFAWGPVVVPDNDERIILMHNELNEVYGLMTVSTLRFEMKAVFAEISVTCFAHNYDEMNLLCRESDLFCVKLHNLRLAKIENRAMVIWFFFPIFIVLGVLAAIAWCKFGDSDTEAAEAEQGIDKPIRIGNGTVGGALLGVDKQSSICGSTVDGTVLGNEKPFSVCDGTVTEISVRH